jgi:predicted negative regulator of RcsB-dependent stress response
MFVRAEARHQLKQDRFRGTTLQVAENAAHWSVEHKSKLTIGGIVVLIVAAVVLGGWSYLNHQDEKASVDLSKAVRAMETPIRPAGTPAQPDIPSFGSQKERAAEAHKQLQAIVDQYSHTRSGEIARYFLGMTSADMGDFAAAQKELGAVASSRNSDLASLAKLAQAAVYRQQDQNKPAIEIYKALADKPTRMVSKASAQLELAATLMAAKQPLEAKGMYERVQKENPATPAAQIATTALQELK